MDKKERIKLLKEINSDKRPGLHTIIEARLKISRSMVDKVLSLNDRRWNDNVINLALESLEWGEQEFRSIHKRALSTLKRRRNKK